MMKLFLTIVLLIDIAAYSCAQTADSSILHLNPVIIESPRLQVFNSGQKILNLDSTRLDIFQHQSLAELLCVESPIFIRLQGPGLLASSAFRGGNAHHMAIFWNGMPLFNPMNGMIDLSLIPVNIADKVNIQFGGGAASFGSGGVSGAIHLIAAPVFENTIRLETFKGFGSFNSFKQYALVSGGSKKYSTRIKIFHQFIKNDFLYYVPHQDKLVNRMNNAEQEARGLIWENVVKISPYQSFHAHFWIQQNHRNIPPTIYELTNLSSQKDFAFRFNGSWNFSKGSFFGILRTALSSEQLIYQNPLVFIRDTSRNLSFFTEYEFKLNLHPKHYINGGIQNNFLRAWHPAYSKIHLQTRPAIYLSYLYKSSNTNFEYSLTLRQEFRILDPVPPVFSSGLRWNPFRWIAIKMNGGRVYRIPTFNDLFWNPGGNPNLKPESGYTADAGIQFLRSFGKFQFNLEATLFSRTLNNWIIWLPQESIWASQNLLRVWSRGLESQSELAFSSRKMKLSCTFISNYVLSENTKSKNANDLSVGRQLIYTPRYNFSGIIKLENRYFLVQYHHQYVGYRFTTSDNSDYLMPYDVGSIYVSTNYSIEKLNRAHYRIFFQIGNLWNEDYQIIKARPMPGRNFQLGLIIQLDKTLKT